MEKDIKVVCRKQDADKVKKASEDAKKDFEEQTGFQDVKLEVVQDLPEGSCVVPSLESPL
jgi:hypothetical protein